jgi:hypothetical protein
MTEKATNGSEGSLASHKIKVLGKVKPKKSKNYLSQNTLSDDEKVDQNLLILYNYFSQFQRENKIRTFDSIEKKFDFTTFLLFHDKILKPHYHTAKTKIVQIYNLVAKSKQIMSMDELKQALIKIQQNRN